MTQLMEICKERRFPQPLAKPCWVSHIFHKPDGGHSQRSFFQRRRSTLESSIFCPKDGEYLTGADLPGRADYFEVALHC